MVKLVIIHINKGLLLRAMLQSSMVTVETYNAVYGLLDMESVLIECEIASLV